MNNGYDATKLTAYALGELDEAEQMQFARHIQENPEAQREVEEIRALAGVLTDELEKEPGATLTAAQREKIEQRLTTSMRVVGGAARGRSWRSWVAVGAAAAACLAVGTMVVLPLSNPAKERVNPALYAQQDGPAFQVESDPNSIPHPGLAGDPTRDASAGKFLPVPKEMMGLGSSVAMAGTDGTVIPPGPAAFGNGMSYGPGARTLAPVDIKLPKPSYVGTPKALPPGVVGPGSGNVQLSRSPWQYASPVGPVISQGTLNIQPETPEPRPYIGSRYPGGESYDRVTDNPFLKVLDQPLSTFSIDVDTASYSNLRRFITGGQLPPKDAVRIEEMINYFPYAYQAPDGPHPFSVNVEVSACPWNGQHRLARIALKGKEIPPDQRPPANLVFLIDVSGSMEPANKLPLLKQGMKMLVQKLSEADRVSIVVYAGNSGLALPSTSCERKDVILGAIDQLQAGGSTNGAEGIQLAYQIATSTFLPKGTNRVILATDGDFNVGITNQTALVQLIEEKAKSGVFLSVLGFGMGNLKDGTMEKLADKGNGNYAYIDDLKEAHKVLVDQMAGTLITIAKDVKLQLEFNPMQVAGHRLIGYENRMLRKEDFNDDRKDAGEIGAGHTVTALYEIVPAGLPVGAPPVDGLKYQKPQPRPEPVPAAVENASNELLTVKLRYKLPDGEKSTLMEVPVADGGKDLTNATDDFRFAAAVASYGMILRDSPYRGTATLSAALELAKNALGKDEAGHRREFLSLVQLTSELKAPGR